MAKHFSANAHAAAAAMRMSCLGCCLHPGILGKFVGTGFPAPPRMLPLLVTVHGAPARCSTYKQIAWHSQVSTPQVPSAHGFGAVSMLAETGTQLTPCRGAACLVCNNNLYHTYAAPSLQHTPLPACSFTEVACVERDWGDWRLFLDLLRASLFARQNGILFPSNASQAISCHVRSADGAIGRKLPEKRSCFLREWLLELGFDLRRDVPELARDRSAPTQALSLQRKIRNLSSRPIRRSQMRVLGFREIVEGLGPQTPHEALNPWQLALCFSDARSGGQLRAFRDSVQSQASLVSTARFSACDCVKSSLRAGEVLN